MCFYLKRPPLEFGALVESGVTKAMGKIYFVTYYS